MSLFGFNKKFLGRNSLGENDYVYRRKDYLGVVFRVYILAGIIVAFLSLLYFAKSYFEIEITLYQSKLLALAGVGVVVSFSSWIMLVYRDRQYKDRLKAYERYSSIGMLLSTWEEFEFVAKDRLDSEKIEYSEFSVWSMLKALVEAEIVTPQEYDELYRAMKVRNVVVHNIPHSEVLIDSIIEVNTNLQHMVDKLRDLQPVS
ncbi:hypothetical protein [Cobetia sp. 5-25-4-2]|uniref:hypothetical protein n=1 Tax=Cobetia sp. 5-25-4-2 TaxID=2737459 RepID=UPI001596D804|nr:hypothetical protein [Cobetia sp. 5-25-4-2]